MLIFFSSLWVSSVEPRKRREYGATAKVSDLCFMNWKRGWIFKSWFTARRNRSWFFYTSSNGFIWTDELSQNLYMHSSNKGDRENSFQNTQCFTRLIFVFSLLQRTEEGKRLWTIAGNLLQSIMEQGTRHVAVWVWKRRASPAIQIFI